MPGFLPWDNAEIINIDAIDGLYGVGEELWIHVYWSDVVYVTGQNVDLQMSTNQPNAHYQNGSGTSTLSFLLVIIENGFGNHTGHIQGWDLNGGSIQNASGGDVNLSIPDIFAFGLNVTFDGDAPDFSNAHATDGYYGLGDTVVINVTFDETVYVTGNPSLILSNSGQMVAGMHATADYHAGSGTTVLEFHYTVDVADDLQRRGIAASPLENVADQVERDEGMRGYYLEYQRGDVPFLAHQQPFTWNGQRLPTSPSPGLGEHNVEILQGELGLDSETVADLVIREIVH